VVTQRQSFLLFIIASFLIFAPENILAQEINIPALVQAIYHAEGAERAKKPFGILSVPCSDYADCRRVCTRTVKNNLRRWHRAGKPGDFIAFLGNRYAPVKCHKLNRNWIKNVSRLYHKGQK
jgi:hypothetical protein